jgi:hypothetical protein
LAQICADAFQDQNISNGSLSNNADIVQIKSANGQTGIWHLDFTGTAVFS